MSNDFLTDLKKINKNASIIEDSTLGNIHDWISTGSLALNSILSGSLKKGIPCGRVTTLMGESGTGKSFIAGRIAAEAQKQNYDVIYFDSENAIDAKFLGRLGVDISKLLYLPVVTLEEFRNQTYKILEKIEEKYYGKTDKKVLIILDSLGNLPSQKELNDAEKGHDASDMGLRAKIIKAMTRLLTAKLAKLNVALLITNHTYAVPGPNPMTAPTETPQGGRGVIYLSTIIILLKKYKLKEDKEDTKKISGNRLKATTTKNRIIPEMQNAEMKVDFKTGPIKYYGLIDMAIKSGVLNQDGKKFVVDHIPDKKFWERELLLGGDDGTTCEEIWSPLLDRIDEYLHENSQFSSISEDEITEDKKEELLIEETETEDIL